MKILLDENIDVNFIKEFGEYSIETVRSMKWFGKMNGDLLTLAVQNGFEIFITLDSNLKFQQNLSNFNIFIINLKSKDSKISSLNLFIPQLIIQIQRIQENKSEKFIELTLIAVLSF